MTLFVGTSGWAYPEWKPGFYPADLPRRRWLEHYSNNLSACEVNATFYRLQKPDTFKNWVGETSETFRFATKAHRGLTHSSSIAPDGSRTSLLEAFLGSVSNLGEQLGTILFQFPPYRKRSDDDLMTLIDALPGDRPYVFEFRHESWGTPEVTKMIAARGGTVCLSETKGDVPPSLPDGPIAYVRLRHDRYSPAAREAWQELLVAESEHRDVYAFAKHEGIPAGDEFGGVGMAQWLAANV
jgi:uncharacterized protein YecE (DUF72 family)